VTLVVLLLLLTPFARAKDAALVRIDLEQAEIERVLDHPELWRVAHRRRQEVHERYWILEPPPREDAMPRKETILTLPGMTVAQAGECLALFAEEEELEGLDRAQHRLFVARINGRELDREEDLRVRGLLKALGRETKQRERAFRTRVLALLSTDQRRALKRVAPRMSPRAREIAYERLLTLRPELAAQWRGRIRRAARTSESPFVIAKEIATQRAMGARLMKLQALARRVLRTVSAKRISRWIAEPAPKWRPRAGVALWVVVPNGAREIDVQWRGKGVLAGSDDWGGTLPAFVAAKAGAVEIVVKLDRQEFRETVTIPRRTRAVYILGTPTGIRTVTVERR